MGNKTAESKLSSSPTLFCPISSKIMQQPYLLPCNHTFDYLNLQKYITKNQQCPVCKKKYKITDAKPNKKVIKALQEYHQIRNQQIKQQNIQVYHSGHIESFHKSSKVYSQKQYYKVKMDYDLIQDTNKCPTNFYLNMMQNEGFIRCADTEDQILKVTMNAEQQKSCSQQCKNLILLRQWSCCMQRKQGKWDDMQKIKGCCKK